jgi:5-methylcytosine-specific restriction endonuclease McrA
MVYVLSKDGKPLMPTTRYGKVRKLLKQKLAKVVKREPFTIQLLYDTTEYTQDITVGIDIGSKTIGVSAISNNKELFSAEIILRQDIRKLLLERKECKRKRRYRKRRYRKPRFINRKKPNGWLPPSIKWKVDAHIRTINFLSKILPISKIIVEIAPFDTQKIINPNINGKEYQNGVQKEFWNIRKYCLWRAGYRSEISGKRGMLEVHHIIPKSKGGTDNPSNLIVLTEEEHKAIHEGRLKIPKSKLKKIKILKDASHVSTIGWYIINKLKEKQYNVEITYGYITKAKRMEIELEKTHKNDAFTIARGDKDTKRLNYWYIGRFFRRQNRSLHRANPIKGGKRPVNTIKQAYGFKRFDKIEYQEKVHLILALRSSGYFSIGSITGEKTHDSVKYNKLKLIESAKTLIFKRKTESIILL